MAFGKGSHTVALNIQTEGETGISAPAGGTLELTGVINGGGSLTKTGGGTVALTGANTFTGGARIGAGTVAPAFAAALGSGPVTFAGGTLVFSGGVQTLGGGVIMDGSGTLNTGDGTVASTLLYDKSGTLRHGGSSTIQATGDATVQGAVELASNQRSVQVNNGATLAINGPLLGPGTVVKEGGAGNLVLASTANSYSGGTLLKTGTLTLDNGATPGSGALIFALGDLGTLSPLDWTMNGGYVSLGRPTFGRMNAAGGGRVGGGVRLTINDGIWEAREFFSWKSTDDNNMTNIVTLNGGRFSIPAARSYHGGGRVILNLNGGVLGMTGATAYALTQSCSDSDYLQGVHEVNVLAGGFVDFGRELGDELELPFTATIGTFGTLSGGFSGWRARNAGYAPNRALAAKITVEGDNVILNVISSGLVIWLR